MSTAMDNPDIKESKQLDYSNKLILAPMVRVSTLPSKCDKYI